MNIADINDIAEKLGEHFRSLDMVGQEGRFAALYTNDSIPTSELPESFLEINGNGPLTSGFSQMGLLEYSLSLVVNVRLRSDSTINTVREKYLTGLLEKGISEPVTIGQYHYSLDKNNLVYSGRDLISGYSSKIININVKIY